MKLTKAQQKTFDEIKSAPVGAPDEVYGWTWRCTVDYVKPYFTWHAGHVYGRFNTATLRALEKVNLIRVHRYGGAHMADDLEVISEV